MPPVKIWDSVLKVYRARLLPPPPPPPLLPPPPPTPLLPPPAALHPPPPTRGRWSNFRADAAADIYSKTVKLFSGAVFCAIGLAASRVSSTDLGVEIKKRVKSTTTYKLLFPSNEKVVASVPQSLVVDILVLQALASTGPFSKNYVKDAHSFLWGVPGGIYAEVEALKRKKQNETAKKGKKVAHLLCNCGPACKVYANCG